MDGGASLDGSKLPPRDEDEVGQVLGTEDSQALEYWVGIYPDRYLELDDVVAVTTTVPGRGSVQFFGVVDEVRARFEGAEFDSDVFYSSRGVLPLDVVNVAHVSVTRVEPEIFVAPQPGTRVVRARGAVRDQALFFDKMARRFPAGLSRDGQPVYGNLEFLDGTRGAHVNISGVSGVATKTSYALFLLYGLFHGGALGLHAPNARALVFNVKGEDLLFLDRPNQRLVERERDAYALLGLPAGPFQSVALWAPPRRNSPVLLPDTGSRQEGIRAYYWSLWEFCSQRLLRFLFADADNESNQIAYVVNQVETWLAQPENVQPVDGSDSVLVRGQRVDSFEELVAAVQLNLEAAVRNAASATLAAFARRLDANVSAVGHLVRGGARYSEPEAHAIDLGKAQLTVVDIHQLQDRAKRFVVGVLLKRIMEEKDRLGTRHPLTFVVLDELNKYAPREGWSPIKEVLLDVAERGRSLGVVLIGAQQTASDVEPRIVGNASFRVVGRLDTAEALRGEYGFLTGPTRARATILKPGSMFLLQPELPVPLLVRFPFPGWATRPDEAQIAAAPDGLKWFERGDDL